MPSDQDHDDAIIGRIGRSLTMEENKPPEEGLAEVTREAWKAAFIVIDPKEHADGQKVAVEIEPRSPRRAFYCRAC